MTICPIALTVHCKGCPLVKFCPAKSLLGDFDTYVEESENSDANPSSESPESE